jgi:hypothetical protein
VVLFIKGGRSIADVDRRDAEIDGSRQEADAHGESNARRGEQLASDIDR